MTALAPDPIEPIVPSDKPPEWLYRHLLALTEQLCLTSQLVENGFVQELAGALRDEPKARMTRLDALKAKLEHLQWCFEMATSKLELDKES